ncbi:MAG: hypothetical protein OZSIB_2732 [Candidatus Ozemobacter sibiricus]|jgi:HAMP domain-containing protein|uniref:HAMP domain-containing protein n=1 Tax=Candidatus Ozemobacter sibiricus TaxID=2268124 RepID=A0A367ZRS9_9BACT|nr:MAG: hypothetical protein OZSIB_2732 [Candidatus Ozemobacter sibiricus]
MLFTAENRYLERVFLLVILLTLSSFAYYFTMADREEVQGRFANRREVIVKLLGRELHSLLKRRADLTPRLTNLLAEEGVAYALVQQPTGEVLAKAETPMLSVGALTEVESEALRTPYLAFFPLTDPSGTIPLVEAALPIVTETGRKLVLRVGFFAMAEEERLRAVRFRNVLLFSVLLLGLFTYWFIRRRHASDFQTTLMGGIGLVILLLFLVTRFALQHWYDTHWRQSFVQHGMSMAKVAALPAKRFLATGDDSDLRELQSLFELDDNYAFLSIAKDEQYLYHSDPSYKNTTFTPDANYAKSQNSPKPQVFPLPEGDLYEVLIPLMEGQHRLGTMRLGFRNALGAGPLSVIRNQLILIFLAGLSTALFLAYLLARRVAKDLAGFIKAMDQVTAGDLRQQVYIDRDDEFGQFAQAFNFMLMSLRERDLLGKGLQNYVSKSIVDKTLKALAAEEKNGEKVFAVAVFMYFHGLGDAMGRVSAPQLLAEVRDLYQAARQICPTGMSSTLQVTPVGILTVLSHANRHETLMSGIQTAQLLGQALARRPEISIAPKLTLHALEVVYGAIDDHGPQVAFLGETMLDFRSFGQVQDSDEIIFSQETYYLLKEVAQFDELEVSTADQGRVKGFIFRGFKPLDALTRIFSESSVWVKILILKVLRGATTPIPAETLIEWFKDPEWGVRYHVLDLLERMRPPGLLDFIIGVVQSETEPRVLSKAVSVLGKVGNESHIPILAERLRSSDRRVKANTIEALESIGGKKVYEFLNLLVDEQDNRVKANILIALGKYGDLRVFDLLTRMIKDPDKNIRASAAYALGKLGMAQGVEPLISALSDKDLGVRRQVVASLTALKADLEIDL